MKEENTNILKEVYTASCMLIFFGLLDLIFNLIFYII